MEPHRPSVVGPVLLLLLTVAGAGWAWAAWYMAPTILYDTHFEAFNGMSPPQRAGLFAGVRALLLWAAVPLLVGSIAGAGYALFAWRRGRRAVRREVVG